MIMWIQIITTNKIIIDENGESPNVYGNAYKFSIHLNRYITVCAMNNLVRCLALIQYFEFSRKLSMFSEILSSATYDITFFAIMFIIVLVSYSLSTHILFGIRNEDFANIDECLMSCILIILGAYDIRDINTIDNTILRIVGITFLFVNLLLLNMFIAIISSYYFEYYAENSSSDQDSLPKLITRIIFPKEIEMLLKGNKNQMVQDKN